MPLIIINTRHSRALRTRAIAISRATASAIAEIDTILAEAAASSRGILGAEGELLIPTFGAYGLAVVRSASDAIGEVIGTIQAEGSATSRGAADSDASIIIPVHPGQASGAARATTTGVGLADIPVEAYADLSAQAGLTSDGELIVVTHGAEGGLIATVTTDAAAEVLAALPAYATATVIAGATADGQLLVVTYNAEGQIIGQATATSVGEVIDWLNSEGGIGSRAGTSGEGLVIVTTHASEATATSRGVTTAEAITPQIYETFNASTDSSWIWDELLTPGNCEVWLKDNSETELSGGGYARQDVEFTETLPDEHMDNDSDVTFPVATATWTNINVVEIRRKSDGFKLAYHYKVISVRDGEQLIFKVSDIDISFLE